MVRWRQARSLACVAALALAAAGCGGGSGNGNGEAEGGGSYSIAILEPSHLIPGNENEAYGLDVLSGLFEGLVSYDPKDGHPINDVAESITSKDQQHWTITIKKGWTFHNGEPVTAQSFVDAWNATAYGPNGWGNNYFFANIEGYDALNPEKEGAQPKAKTMSGLKVVDEATFKVTLKDPFSQFPLTLGYAAFYPMPKAAFDDLEKFERAPIGNGPYMMDGTWKHHQSITLKSYPDYSGPRKPHADEVVFKIYTDFGPAYNDLIGGGVDIMTSVPAARVPDARQQFGDRFITAPNSTMDYLAFPVYDERFQNPDLRHAVSMAIDRKAITEKIFNGTYTPMHSLLAPIVPGYREDPCGEFCTYDPAKAKQLFEKAGGWHGTLYLWYSTDPTNEAWMSAVRNQLRQNLGISDIRFKSVEHAQLFDILDAHKATGPYRQNWYMDYPASQDYLEPLYATGGSSNRSGYSNKKVDALIDEANAASSLQESIDLYRQAEDLILKDMPVTPLWNWVIQAAYTKHVSNVHIDAYVGLHLDQVTVND